MLLVSENENVFLGNQAIEAVQSLFEHGGSIEQIEQLLGAGITAQGPEAAAAASGKNNGIGGTGGHGMVFVGSGGGRKSLFHGLRAWPTR